MRKRKQDLKWWIIGALGAGIVLSIGIYAIVNYCNRNRSRDPRSSQVNELIREAEVLIEMGKRGTYYAKRSRG